MALSIFPQIPYVVIIVPSFITPQDGDSKQDCELKASKRWVEQYADDYSSIGVPLLHMVKIRITVLEGDGLHILAPTQALTDEANRTEKWNNHSYVLWFVYKGVSVVFGGDAEKEVWDSIVANYGANLSCYVLKASHHGRDSGYHQKAVELMKPIYTIVSVGKKPETDASNKYKDNSNFVWSTRWKGNIHLTIFDNGEIDMVCQYPN